MQRWKRRNSEWRLVKFRCAIKVEEVEKDFTSKGEENAWIPIFVEKVEKQRTVKELTWSEKDSSPTTNLVKLNVSCDLTGARTTCPRTTCLHEHARLLWWHAMTQNAYLFLLRRLACPPRNRCSAGSPSQNHRELLNSTKSRSQDQSVICTWLNGTRRVSLLVQSFLVSRSFVRHDILRILSRRKIFRKYN